MYPLRDIVLPQTMYETTQDVDRTTRSCFAFVLIRLEQLFMEQQEEAPIGVVITAQGETYGLALFRHGSEIIYVLMNSHGDVTGPRERTNAYVLATTDQAVMVDKLAALIRYLENEVDDVPLEVRAWLNAEMDRDFSLSPVRLEMITPDINPSSSITDTGEVDSTIHSTETPTGEPSKGEAEKTNYLALILLLAGVAMITFRNRLISMITSYTRKDGQVYLPPPSSSSIVK